MGVAYYYLSFTTELCVFSLHKTAHTLQYSLRTFVVFLLCGLVGFSG